MEAIIIFAVISAANIFSGIAISEQMPAYQQEQGQVEVIDEVAMEQPSPLKSDWIKSDSDA